MSALLDNTVLSNFAVIQRADLIELVLAADAATTRAAGRTRHRREVRSIARLRLVTTHRFGTD